MHHIVMDMSSVDMFSVMTEGGFMFDLPDLIEASDDKAQQCCIIGTGAEFEPEHNACYLWS